jgi:hypothetical protein
MTGAVAGGVDPVTPNVATIAGGNGTETLKPRSNPKSHSSDCSESHATLNHIPLGVSHN